MFKQSYSNIGEENMTFKEETVFDGLSEDYLDDWSADLFAQEMGCSEDDTKLPWGCFTDKTFPRHWIYSLDDPWGDCGEDGSSRTNVENETAEELVHPFDDDALNADPMWNTFSQQGEDEDEGNVDPSANDPFSSRSLVHPATLDAPPTSPSCDATLLSGEDSFEMGSDVTLKGEVEDVEGTDFGRDACSNLFGADFLTLGTSWNNQGKIGDWSSFNPRLTNRFPPKMKTTSRAGNVKSKNLSDGINLLCNWSRSSACSDPLFDNGPDSPGTSGSDSIEFYMLKDAGLIKLNCSNDLPVENVLRINQQVKKRQTNKPSQAIQKRRVKQTKGLTYREFRDLQNRAERIRRSNHRCLFLHLRMLLPTVTTTKKKTKLSTLTDALNYCQYLQRKHSRLWNNLWLELSRQMELKHILRHYCDSLNTIQFTEKELT